MGRLWDFVSLLCNFVFMQISYYIWSWMLLFKCCCLLYRRGSCCEGSQGAFQHLINCQSGQKPDFFQGGRVNVSFLFCFKLQQSHCYWKRLLPASQKFFFTALTSTTTLHLTDFTWSSAASLWLLLCCLQSDGCKYFQTLARQLSSSMQVVSSERSSENKAWLN